MTESYEKNIVELSDEQAVESAENIELKKSFADELRKPENGLYLKKLRAMGGALALAGITVFAPYQQKEAVAPETTREYIIAKSGSDLRKETLKNMELFKRVDKALEERGGIEISPQLETVYKVMPEITKMIAKGIIARGETPYFSKPDIILGKEFINKYPEKSKEYMENIGNAMKATVLIETPTGSEGSGVLVELDGEIVVLTNAHVIKNFNQTKVSFINGETMDLEQDYQDGELDLGILKSKEKNRLKKVLESGAVKVLNKNKIDFGELNNKETIAFVGNPLKFTYEVGISKTGDSSLTKDENPIVSGNYSQKRNFNSITYKTDPRFGKLAKFHQKDDMPDLQKGFGIPGMSGGPVISLDNGGKLVGINAFGNNALLHDKLSDANREEYHGGAINGKEIQKFLKNYKESRKMGRYQKIDKEY